LYDARSFLQLVDYTQLSDCSYRPAIFHIFHIFQNYAKPWFSREKRQFLRSSRSVFVPYHFATFPDRSRGGLPRNRNQRNSPSKQGKRPSTSNGFTESKASRYVSRIRGRSSG